MFGKGAANKAARESIDKIRLAQLDYNAWPDTIEAGNYTLQKIDDTVEQGQPVIRYEVIAANPEDKLNNDEFLLSPTHILHRPLTYTDGPMGKIDEGSVEEIGTGDGTVEGTIEVVQQLLSHG